MYYVYIRILEPRTTRETKYVGYEASVSNEKRKSKRGYTRTRHRDGYKESVDLTV